MKNQEKFKLLDGFFNTKLKILSYFGVLISLMVFIIEDFDLNLFKDVKFMAFAIICFFIASYHFFSKNINYLE